MANIAVKIEAAQRRTTIGEIIEDLVAKDIFKYMEVAMRKAILMMLLAVVSGSAVAEWVVVGRTETRTVYIDPATIRKAGNRVKMWSLDDALNKVDYVAGVKPFMSTKEQVEYDCKEEQSRTLYIYFHSGNMGGGEVVYVQSDIGEWTPVAPGSIGNTLLRIACGKEVTKGARRSQ